AKYLKGLAKLKFDGLSFADLNVPLDQAPLKSLETGITYAQPIAVGGDSEIIIEAGVSGGLKLYSAKDEQLFDPEVFADPISIKANQFYVGIDTRAKFSPEFTATPGDLSFGLSGDSSIGFSTYRLFEKAEAATFPLWLDALKESLANFAIPRNVDDLAGMSVGSIAAVEGSGSLKVSGEVELLSAINPLASVNLPEPVGTLGVSSGGSIKVGASFEISGAFQIRVHKTGVSKATLGIYRKRGKELNVRATASIGASVAVGDFKPLEPLLNALSSNPKADLEKLKEQLGEGKVDEIKKVVEAGISRKLELALALELTSQTTSTAAFLFEIDLNRLEAGGREALHQALGGNLTKLPLQQENLPTGIALARTIFTEVKKQKHALKFNLLGIYNFISVSTLILKGRVMFEPATGELVITDTATASRISASSLNFAADGEKLRKVLAESVLISAAYRCSNLVTQPPRLKIAHSYFELHTKTDQKVLKNNLDVFEAVGLMKHDEKKGTVASAKQFGRTTLYCETGYNNEVVESLFLSAGKPRPQTDYEPAGRKALELLVESGEEAEGRRLPVTDPQLWKQMTELGQANFSTIDKLRNLPANTLGAITSDYSVIMWWARSMREMGEALAQVREFISKNPGSDPLAEPFKGLRKKLGSKLKDVASKTKSEFGDPWGLVAMDQASGQRATAAARLNSSTLAILRERNAPL
ncbi:MAG TPA: hypothetical protein VFV61_00225, partial [Pyrinomonadaceae bacterium]|nr:hypothetical protein [Pyrinomonadaceae bacterium]